MVTLYFKTGCPFCHKVIDAAGEMDIQLNLKNISDEEVANELIEKGGKRQVPYLVDDEKGEAMYESDDIIAYLQNNYAS